MDNDFLKKRIIHVPISIGELIDKITILEIKKDKLKNLKLKNILNELSFLRAVLEKNSIFIPDEIFLQLKSINLTLWDIEDKIRIKEKNKEFDNEFIKLARSVYLNNDRRSETKKELNIMFNSEIIEEKSYEKY
jgi:hypothetical protein|tara:strand:- start:13 stop:414 length:402 start_codon:yes stop_codon:yes gene_type:complete